MSLNSFLVVAAIAAGMMIAAQGIINGRLASHIGGPVQAAFISFAVGLIALFLVNLVLGHRIPYASALAEVPRWAWIGGVLGAVMVTLAATAVPRIGVATYVSAVIAGQLAAAIAYDHYGMLGQQVREATPLRLLGVAFLAIGVFLIRKF